jgi:hypothetical protein
MTRVDFESRAHESSHRDQLVITGSNICKHGGSKGKCKGGCCSAGLRGQMWATHDKGLKGDAGDSAGLISDATAPVNITVHFS